MTKESTIFAKNLLYYMHVNDKVQNDLIIDLGINKSTISTWCNGIKFPRHNSIKLLSDYFGIDMSDLTEEKPIYTHSKKKEAERIFATLPEDKQAQALDYLRFLARNTNTGI